MPQARGTQLVLTKTDGAIQSLANQIFCSSVPGTISLADCSSAGLIQIYVITSEKTNPHLRGQAARLDFHAHSSRLLQCRVPGDFAHAAHAAGENRSGERATGETVNPASYGFLRSLEGRAPALRRRCQ